MSLRKVKSLPTLRALSGVSNPIMRPPTPRLFLIQASGAKYVHNTPKKDHTTLLTTDKHASFNVMSLKALKNECRSRGLRVSGKKAELVDRILTFENVKPVSFASPSGNRLLHMSSKTNSKGDNKPVDAVKIPDIAATEKNLSQAEKDYIVHIPSLTREATNKPITKVEKVLNTSNPDQAASKINEPTVATPDNDNVIFRTDAPLKQAEIINDDVELVSGENESGHGDPGSSQKELSSKDKKFLLGFAATVGAWWALKFRKNKTDS